MGGAGTVVGRVRLVIVGLLAAVTFTGSMGIGPAGASAMAPTNRACELLTAKPVKSALGTPVGVPKPSKSAGKSSCDWKTTGAAESPEMVSIAIYPLTKAEKAKFADLADDPDNVVFDDLGDEAVLECNGARRGKCLTWGKLWVAFTTSTSVSSWAARRVPPRKPTSSRPSAGRP